MTIPSKASIVEHWKDELHEYMVDWVEPSCWACNKFWWGRYDIKIQNPNFEEIMKNWNKITPLERCHIVPTQFGGNDKAENLFLLCKECHDKAPNTRSRTAFLHWAKQQCYFANLKKEIMEELKTYGLENKFDQIYEIFKEGIPDDVKENLGIHFSKLSGPKLTASTLIAAISIYLKDIEKS